MLQDKGCALHQQVQSVADLGPHCRCLNEQGPRPKKALISTFFFSTRKTFCPFSVLILWSSALEPLISPTALLYSLGIAYLGLGIPQLVLVPFFPLITSTEVICTPSLQLNHAALLSFSVRYVYPSRFS